MGGDRCGGVRRRCDGGEWGGGVEMGRRELRTDWLCRRFLSTVVRRTRVKLPDILPSNSLNTQHNINNVCNSSSAKKSALWKTNEAKSRHRQPK